MTKAQDAKAMQGKCSLENSVLENDLESAAQQGTITEIRVVETDKGFYVVVKIRWTSEKDWYVTTRRNRDAPKIYKDLNRLNEHLKVICPKANYLLERSKDTPKPKRAAKKKSVAKRRTTKKAAKKKSSK